MIQVHVGLSGEFRLGPLAAVDYHIHAFTYPTVASTGGCWVTPGRDDVVLGIAPSGVVEGRVVDALTGEGVDGEVDLVHANGGSKSVIIGSLGPGHFRFESVLPGSYTISAHTADGRFAFIDGVEVEEGGTTEAVTLRLEPGGFIDLARTGGPKFARCSLSARGTVFRDLLLRPEQRTLQCVPVGVVDVCIYSGYGKTREVLDGRSIDVAAGERRPLDFRLDP